MNEVIEQGMSEADEQTIVKRSPLDATHRRLGATMMERDGWSLPASYTSIESEYAAVRDGSSAGLIDFSTRGRIEVSGAEAVQFLNGLITNDVKTLEDGAWMTAAFPNVQGRLLAHARVLRRENSYLFDTDAATHERVLKLLERFTLAGDFRVQDLTSATALLSLQGAQAAQIVEATLGETASQVEHGRIINVAWKEKSSSIIRATHTAEDGFDLFVNVADAPALWDVLVANGAQPVGAEALELLRIEAGEPRYGVDMDDTNVVLETGLDDAVSYTKGCYIGQEIIARIHWRGHVAKRLAGLILLDEAISVERDAKIKTSEGKEIGRVTSSAFSPRLNKTIALGYVKYDYLAAGTELRVMVGEEEHAAHVAILPFVRGSWTQPAAEMEPKG
jgi:glycine cleavage system T protein